MKETSQLQVIVKESGLEKTKADVILKKFQDYFKIAAEWEQKAKTIHVINEVQTADMRMARVGRLFLRDKRIEIEKTRKELKEQSLREGKAIDGIANVLKALIVPVEEYLGKQEHFVEIREKEVEEKKRLEIERKMEEDRIAQEKAEEEERKRIRIENETLKKDAEKREREIIKERAKVEAERQTAEEKVRKEKEELERSARIEREKQEKIIDEQRVKAEKERLIAEEKARKIKAENEAKLKIERKEREALEAKLAAQIECPYCHKKFVPEKKRINND